MKATCKHLRKVNVYHATEQPSDIHYVTAPEDRVRQSEYIWGKIMFKICFKFLRPSLKLTVASRSVFF